MCAHFLKLYCTGNSSVEPVSAASELLNDNLVGGLYILDAQSGSARNSSHTAIDNETNWHVRWLIKRERMTRLASAWRICAEKRDAHTEKPSKGIPILVTGHDPTSINQSWWPHCQVSCKRFTSVTILMDPPEGRQQKKKNRSYIITTTSDNDDRKKTDELCVFWVGSTVICGILVTMATGRLATGCNIFIPCHMDRRGRKLQDAQNFEREVCNWSSSPRTEQVPKVSHRSHW